ncbi:hypothetical protein ACU4GD_05665 [Cupriavidus basilensis]
MAPGADGSLDADALTVTAAAAGDGFVLDGQVAQVFDAAGADWLLVPARLSGDAAGQPALFLLQTAALAGQSGSRAAPAGRAGPYPPAGRPCLRRAARGG